MIDLQKIGLLKRKKASSLLGLSVDANRLEGVVLRRTNGSVEKHQSFSVALTLDLLTDEPVLVGREIRNQLEAAGVRERHCVVGLPLKWVLVAHTKIPDLPEADIAGVLQIEAERSFPCDVETLVICTSRFETAAGEKYATLLGVPRTHLDRLEQVLHAAQLKPQSFSLGIAEMQSLPLDPSKGRLILMAEENSVGLLVTCGSGIAALRSLEGSVYMESGQRKLNSDLVAREIRITLGHLPAACRDAVREVRIYGSREPAQELSREMESRLKLLGLKAEVTSSYSKDDFKVQIPSGSVVNPAFSIATRRLESGSSALEFLPPKISAFQQLVSKYSTGVMQKAALAAGLVAFLVAGLFFYQQVQLWRLGSDWNAIATKVRVLDEIQQNIRQYRPWYDASFRNMSVLRQLTGSFPEDGSVTAKTIEIREQGRVTCTGVARDNQALLKTMERLRDSKSIAELKVDQIRGKSPMQFSFDFIWIEGKE